MTNSELLNYLGSPEFWNRKLGRSDHTQNSNYPPFNILKCKDLVILELAVAGFSSDDLSVEYCSNKHELYISGNKDSNNLDDVEVLHKGIGMRKFTRTFHVEDNLDVDGVQLENGVLRVTFKRAKDAIPTKLKIKEK